MERIKIVFIINPHSGTSDKKDLPAKIKSSLSADKFDIETVFTEYAGHGKLMAKEYAEKGYDAVIACGGDGTVNEIASSLTETNTAFGIIPYGSGNGLARHLGIPMNVDKALEMVSHFNVKVMDYGMANDSKFFCTCGTGFDAWVSWQFANAGTRGLLTYIKVIVNEYKNYKPLKYKLTMEDGSVKEEDAFLITFANASQYGNDAFIAPNASVKDGLLDVVIMKDFKIWSAPKLAFQLMRGTLDNSKYTSRFKAKKIELIRPSEAPFHLDGDPKMEDANINIKVIPSALKVIADKA